MAKQNHDFIGFTPDPYSDDLGWVSVNHEQIVRNDSIGDGGGMTVFKVKRDPYTEELEVVEQTLSEGRTGKYFNVDFVNTVGETGMNCGGISSKDGGPYLASSPSVDAYPENHLSNPDGLNFLNVNGQTYMVICEDLNGTSNGRVPAGIDNRTCELYLLDMSIDNPTVEDLVRVSIVPQGVEVTGAIATPDGKTLFVNSQHPRSSNPFPYNNSLTYAITGWDTAISQVSKFRNEFSESAGKIRIYPNPVARTLNFDKVIDAAIYF